MSRWIDDKWLEDNAKEYSLGYYEEDEWAIPLSLLEEAPSIDIVRCEECKRANHELSGVYCGISDVLMGEGGFCSIGEREGE